MDKSTEEEAGGDELLSSIRPRIAGLRTHTLRRKGAAISPPRTPISA